jgi:UDP-glucose 4-epimerase
MVTQAGVEATPTHAPLRQGEVLRSSLDPARAAIHLGWKPWTGLAAGTAAVIEFIRQRLADES